MRIAFAGTPEVAVPSLQLLAESASHQLVAVITRPDAPVGRGRHMQPSPVALAGQQLGVPVLKPAHPKDPAFQANLRELAVDVVAVVAYGALLPASALAIPPLGWVNLHFSVLPAWRGAAPVQRAIWAGDDVTGATTFQIVQALDAGPVYGHLTYTMPPRATAGQVLKDLAEQGAPLLAATLDGLADGSIRAVPQGDDGASYAHKVTVDDAFVRWDRPAWAIDRQIRACTPEPGAWCKFRGQRLKLGPVALDAVGSSGQVTGLDAAPGAITVTKKAVFVATATGPVKLSVVAPAGKSFMDAAAWARGARIEEGELL